VNLIQLADCYKHGNERRLLSSGVAHVTLIQFSTHHEAMKGGYLVAARLRRGYAAARCLGLRVRIPPEELMSLSCVLCVVR